MERAVKLFSSKAFKWVTLVLGILFMVLAFSLSLDPEPFLKYGYWGVYVFNLVGPGVFIIPALSRRMSVLLLAFASAAGMLTGDSISWLVGKSGDVIIPRSKGVKRLEKSLHKWGPYALFFWSIIPFPYDLVGVLAGYLEFTYKRFAIPSFLGKFIRFVLLGSGVVAVWGKV